MDLTKFDLCLGLGILTIITIEYQFHTIMESVGLNTVIFLAIFTFFLIWITILAYNITNVTLEYAFSDTTSLARKMKTRRLVRMIILILAILVLFFGTISSVWFLPVSIILAIHLVALRAAFLLLRPEENPFKRPRMYYEGK